LNRAAVAHRLTRALLPIQYSLSASIMALAMAITLGIREQYALAGIFMLTWATQTYGFLTEYISTPKAYVDKNNYKYPVGPFQLKKFAEGAADYGVTDYYHDPAALKLISQTEWEAVRHLASPWSMATRNADACTHSC